MRPVNWREVGLGAALAVALAFGAWGACLGWAFMLGAIPKMFPDAYAAGQRLGR